MASFRLEILLVFSNSPSIFKVMLRNSNLTKFDINFTKFKYDRTNLQNKWAFEKTNKPCFIFILLHPENNFFYTLSWTSNKFFFISGIYTKLMCLITFSYSHDCHKSGKKYNFSFKKFNFYPPILTVEFFGFSPAGPKTKADLPESQQ